MRRILVGLIFLFLGMVSRGQQVARQAPGGMDMLSPFFHFEDGIKAAGMLEKSGPRGSFEAKGSREVGFAVEFTLSIKKFEGEQTVLSIPGVLTVKLRRADHDESDEQNYRPFKMKDGSLPVLEASILLHSNVEKPFRQEMRIGVPIAMLAEPTGEHRVVLNFTGVRWTMYVDDKLCDNDFAIGYPGWGGRNDWNIDPGYVDDARIFFPALKATRDASRKEAFRPGVLFWTPEGHNSWVGDVATAYFKGRYHVFYLFDRRHHRSKFGVGGHYFEHFSTADFITWTEHEAAVPIDEQWETIGTGTPFVYRDKLYISYGLHTSRIYPDSLTMSPRMTDYYKAHGKTGDFRFDLQEAFPSGATYSVCEDDLSSFRKSGALFHYCENPSVFTTPDGKLKMMANYKSKGTWESESLDSGWHCTDPEFPLGGDCTFYFQWGNFEYVVGGFVNLWKRPLGSSGKPWEDLSAEGRDFYNGISVPSVTPIGHGRYLMAGWIKVNGWGGTFAAHELIRYPDGRLGTKWMKELTPVAVDSVLIAKRMDKPLSVPVGDSSFILSFEVRPKKNKPGKLAVSFLPSGGDGAVKACEFQIRPGESIAQYGDAPGEGFSAPEKSLRQGGSPHNVGNYAIENLIGTGKPFLVRILVKNTAKLGGVMLDAEIAGQNTMISYRGGLHVESIAFNLSDVDIRNVKKMNVAD